MAMKQPPPPSAARQGDQLFCSLLLGEHSASGATPGVQLLGQPAGHDLEDVIIAMKVATHVV